MLNVFLRAVLASDLSRLKINHAQYGCMLNHNAGIIDDLITYKINGNHFRIVVNAGNRHSDIEWLRQNSAGYTVDITACSDLATVAVQGPNAQKILNKTIHDRVKNKLTDLVPFSFLIEGQWMCARTGYTGEDGFKVMLPQDEVVNFWSQLIQNGASPAGLGARDTLRLEAGMHLYGQDMNTQTTPLERGLKWNVDLSDETREFIGKKAYLAKKAEGIKN